jgi:3'-5' exonuclease/La domain
MLACSFRSARATASACRLRLQFDLRLQLERAFVCEIDASRLLTRHLSKMRQSKKRARIRYPDYANDANPDRRTERERELDLRREAKQKRSLHKAGKWKRILSACDYWFSKTNLATDDFMRATLKRYRGWMPIKTLLTFPKLQYWTDAQLLLEAFNSSAAGRYIVTFDKSLHLPESSKKVRLADRPNAKVSPVALHSGPDQLDGFGSEELHVKPKKTRQTSVSNFSDDQSSQFDQSHDDECNRIDSTHVPEESTATVEAPDDDWVDYDYDSDEDEIDPSDLDNSIQPSEGIRDFSAVVHASIETQSLDDAFVRHRRVTVDIIETIELQQLQEEEQYVMDNFVGDDSHLDWGFDGMLGFKDLELLEEPKDDKPKPIEYTTKREIRVVRDEQDLALLCHDVALSARSIADSCSNDPKACAIGFDVEYCSLELDIRNTLPAMIQLSSPNERGPVGLVWLDKFKNNGRDILNSKAYAPLSALLSDSSVLKVGVGATKDAENLARWWNVHDKKDMVHFFSGFVDLESEFDERANGKSLQQMCETVLNRRLSKLKGGKRKGSNRRRTPTSHWRADILTAEMKNYAARDAASAIDIWMALHGYKVGKKTRKKAKAT